MTTGPSRCPQFAIAKEDRRSGRRATSPSARGRQSDATGASATFPSKNPPAISWQNDFLARELGRTDLALFLAAFLCGQFFSLGLGEFAQLLFTHRPRHLSGCAFQ